MIDAVLAFIRGFGSNVVLTGMWAGVFVLWIGSVWLSSRRGRAYYTWHADDAPPGQNRIDRAADGCAVGVFKLITWGAFVLAAWQSLETAGIVPRLWPR